MALDRLTKVDGGGISTTSDYRVGIITATKFVGPIEGDVTGSITATDGTFSGNVTIGGTLTYEDVTNIDSVGLITARNGVKIQTGTATTALVVEGNARVTGILTVGTGSITLNENANTINVGTALTLGHTQGLQFHTQNLHSAGFEVNQVNASGIITATGADINGDLDVDGHTNLDNVSISGVTTSGHLNINGDLSINDNYPSIHLNDTDSNNDFMLQNQNGTFTVYDVQGNADRFEILSDGTVRSPHYTLQSASPSLTFTDTNHDSDFMVQNANGLFKIYDTTNSADRVTVASNGNVSVKKDLDVDGHTNLDNVSIAGVTTFASDINTQRISVASGNIITLPDGGRESNEAHIRLGNDGDFRMYHEDGAHTTLENHSSSSDLILMTSSVARNILFKTNGNNERLRISSNGDVTTTGASYSRANAGFTARKGDSVNITRASGTPLEINRTGNNGTVINLFKDQTIIGSVGVDSGDVWIGANGTSYSETLRIDSGGRVLINRTNNDAPGGYASKLQIRDTTYTASISLVRNDPGGGGPALVFGKSRNAAQSDATLVQSGDTLGQIDFYGADGNDMNSGGANITAQVDGTPGSNDMPGRLIFKTTANGAASSTERLRITSNGKVNIGTGELDQTDRLLNVYGGRMRVTYPGNGNSIELMNTASSGNSYGLLIQAGTNSSDYNSTFRNTSGTTLFRIRGDGKIGINEVNPTEMLHIKAEDNTDSFGGIIVYANNNSVYTKHGWRGLDSNEAVRFAISGTEKMRLTNGGKLALGRSSADEMLHITHDDNTDGFGGIKIAANNNSVYVKYGWRGIDGSADLRFGVAGSERLRIDSSGNVLIGTTSATAEFTVRAGGTVAAFEGTGGSGAIAIRDADAGTYVFLKDDGGTFHIQTSGSSYSDKFSILANGNVGIEETSPDTKLHIKNGTLMIETTTPFYSGSGENGENYPTIFFKGDHSSGNNPAHAKITVRHSGQNTYSGDIVLMPRGYYSGSYTYQDVLRVSAYKRVGINEASPENALHISGTTTHSAGSLLRLDATTGDNFIIFDNTSDSSEWVVGNDSTARDEFRLAYNGGSGYNTDIIRIDGTTNNGVVTIDGGTTTLVKIKGDSAGTAGLRLGGDNSQNQCTGFVEVHQDESHGGGFFYNGDGSPSFASSGEAADYFSLYRFSSGSRHVVQRWFHSSNDCEMFGNLTIDNGTSTLIRVRGNNDGTAGISCGGGDGQNQCTGYVEVTQDEIHGGGIFYNGDGSPAFATNETADRVTFYRMHNGTRYEVFSTPYNESSIRFRGDLRPAVTNNIDLGSSSLRWRDVYCNQGAFNNSDETLKQDIASLTTAEMNVAKRLSGLFKTYRWKDAVEEKGTDKARTHTGIIAQQIVAAMEAEGLDYANYGFIGYDEWYQNDKGEVIEIEDANDNNLDGYTKVGRYSVRYTELLSFIAAYNEQRFASIESRLSALEGS